jgi:hypothetical protein
MISKEDLREGLRLLYNGTTIEDEVIEKMSEKIMIECEAYEGDSIHFEGTLGLK